MKSCVGVGNVVFLSCVEVIVLLLGLLLSCLAESFAAAVSQPLEGEDEVWEGVTHLRHENLHQDCRADGGTNCGEPFSGEVVELAVEEGQVSDKALHALG